MVFFELSHSISHFDESDKDQMTSFKSKLTELNCSKHVMECDNYITENTLVGGRDLIKSLNPSVHL